MVDSIIEQLHLVHVTDYVIKIGIGFSKSITEKSYQDFKAYSWSESDKTKELIIRVNFMYEDYDSGNPLKHSLFIRVAREMKPSNILQMLASGANDKLDEFENMTAPVFCRTDHINDKLSKDLIGAVHEWHKGLKQPKLLSGTYELIRKHRESIAKFVHYLFPAVVVMLLTYIAFCIDEVLPSTTNLMQYYVSLVLVCNFLVIFFTAHGNRKAQKIYSNLSKLKNEDVIFDITRGDDKLCSEQVERNKEFFTTALQIFLWVLFQNITASIIAAFIFEALTKTAT